MDTVTEDNMAIAMARVRLLCKVMCARESMQAALDPTLLFDDDTTS